MKSIILAFIFAFTLFRDTEGQQENLLSKLVLGAKLKSFSFETAKFTVDFDEPSLKRRSGKSLSLKRTVGQEDSFPEPPVNPNHARVARYLVHNLGWI